MKKKITHIQIKKTTTVYRKNEKGERVPVQKEITAFKDVNVVTGWRRFGHYIIDRVCIYVFGFIIGRVIGLLLVATETYINLTNVEVKLYDMLLSLLVINPLFYIFWEYYFQKTPGKWATRCRVVDEYGERPSFAQILGRSYARSIPFEAFSCFSDRGWHDTMSNTYVIDEEHLKELKAVMMIDEIGKPAEQNPNDEMNPSDLSGTY